MLNSEHLSLVNKIGDTTEFTITRVHCICLAGANLQKPYMYRTRALIIRGLYILSLSMVSIQEQFLIKSGL